MSTLLWLQSGGCGGCSQSLLLQPDLFHRLKLLDVEVLWHPNWSLSGDQAFWDLIEQIRSGEQGLDYLCLEGAALTAQEGLAHRLAHRLGQGNRTMTQLVSELAPMARDVLAVGSCTAFGGMSAVGQNPAGAIGWQYENKTFGGYLGQRFKAQSGRPVINIAGCAIHPGWFADALSLLVEDELVLDEYNRPALYTDHLAHHGCPRNEYYEYKSGAAQMNSLGCLMENFGCKGTQARGDCNTRLWPGGGSCLRGGFACIDCTAPGFQHPGHPFLETPKVAGLPITLPTDMPKAWFVALSALAKAATPERVKANAASPHLLKAPNQVKEKRT